ncbi:uncharacterized protein LOC115724026 [Cannabis sativa]|uniref:uncharacterized protein LOC115724026 n=1 Tax=Cannabis sativa TaxID=3483 RepID=UPI0029CA4D39|nr:uncharacterized protein LOC115724026 [Cannabis sativa]
MRILCNGGRLTLIQSVLSSLPLYFLSFFKVPKSVTKALEKMMRDFFWEGNESTCGDHLVAWDEACRPRDEGGLPMKWLWRFSLERNSLWHRVVVSRIGRTDNFWDSKKESRLSPKGPWRGIFHIFMMSIWDCAFPDLAVISKTRNASIKELIVDEGLPSGWVESWNFMFRRNLMDREMPSLISLMQKVERVKVLSISDDSRIWKSDLSGAFSYKVNVHDKMQKRKPFQYISPGWCVCCKGSGEDVGHLFLECKFIQRLWINVLVEFELSWEDIVKEIIIFFSNLYTSESRRSSGIDGINWKEISENSARQLEKPFEEDDVKAVVFSCEGSKAPGLDGFSMAVFQSQWDIIKEDLMEVFKAFERGKYSRKHKQGIHLPDPTKAE